jgi:Ca-activated chloride channel homolog
VANANRIALMLGLGTLAACGDGGDLAEPAGTPSRSVTQGGAQDIGQFRKIVAEQRVPSRDLLEEVGFFNEHALDLPPAECGESLCFHPMLAVAPRFNDENWTMAFVAMNTAVDPRTLLGPPRHLILIVERSHAVAQTLSFSHVTSALRPTFGKDDLFSLVVADSNPRLLALARPGHEIESKDVALTQPAQGVYAPPVDLYGALALAYEVAMTPPLSERRQQVLLMTSGDRGGGIQQTSAFEGLAQNFAESGVVISTFGMGQYYQREIPRALSDITSGNYYFAESTADLTEAVSVAGQTGFVPLARQLRLHVTASPGYRIGAVYGAARVWKTHAEAVIEVPNAYIGARSGARDVDSGRRGGGGGFFVELLADMPPGRAPVEEAAAFSLATDYFDQVSGLSRSGRFTLATPLGIGNNPEPSTPFFSDPARAKPFMMLNMYLALGTALSLYEANACGAALGIEDMMRQSYQLWRQRYEDPDIDADFNLLQDLASAIRPACSAPVVRPVEVPITCFFL